MNEYDVVVIGGGIVGLASAWQILNRDPRLRVVVLEKEREVASHQTGRNSGVIHSGIYYKPGSLKAINCREGKLALQQFCDEHGIRYEICGKVIVAVNDEQVTRLEALEQRGRDNGVSCRRIDLDELKEIEPHVRGVAALHVPETGIVNYGQVARKLAQLICSAGGEVRTASRVESVSNKPSTIEISTAADTFSARLAVNCAGLQSDRVGAMLGATGKARIVPFRGEYFTIRPDRGYLCKNLIYPVPDSRFPFLGVHFTRMMDGSIHCGPNAVLAMAREGYQKTNVSFRDLKDSLMYGGFLRLAGKHFRTGLGEMYRSLSKGAFVRALQDLVPEIRAEDLAPAPSGIRAQALMPDGSLVDDFLIDELDKAISVINAPSPAATASLKIGSQIADRAIARL